MTVDSLLGLSRKIAPELIEVLQKRYNILRTISICGPVGRRSLSVYLGLSERSLRGECDFLKNQKLISIKPWGMELTEEGEAVLTETNGVIRELLGLVDLEQGLLKRYKLRSVDVVPGNSAESRIAKTALARVAARRLLEEIRPDDIVSIAGGTTMADLAGEIPGGVSLPEVTVVPARGGLGEDVEIQSSYIAARLAKAISASYFLLHIPDQLSREASRSLQSDPGIRELLAKIKQSNVLAHGIGEAEVMARRRGYSEERVRALKEKGAVAESFGYFFDARGEVVEVAQSEGLRLEDLPKIRTVFVVAGGSRKAQAIDATIHEGYHDVLVTDEGAARSILGGESGKPEF